MTITRSPLAQGYEFVTPQFLEDNYNMFRNGDVTNLANNILQAKPAAAGVDTARIIFNTTFGLLGFFDVGTKMGLNRSDEDRAVSRLLGRQQRPVRDAAVARPEHPA